MTTFIYALVDPRTDEIRYIGKSIRPKERLWNHCNEKSVTWRTNWIREVLSSGHRPQLRILEELAVGTDWQESERQWIAKGKELGWRLTNCTSGGDGVENLPLEIRQKMALTWKGRKHKPEAIAKMAAASRGKKHSAESKAIMVRKMTGRTFTEEWLQKIRVGNSKLTDGQVHEVRRLIADKVSQYVIAPMFGIHQGTVSNIKRRVSYGYVE